MLNQGSEGLPREKKDATWFQGEGVSWETGPNKHRRLGKGLTRTEEVEYLLLTLCRELVDLNATGDDNVEAKALISFGEDGLPPGVLLIYDDLG